MEIGSIYVQSKPLPPSHSLSLDQGSSLQLLHTQSQAQIERNHTKSLISNVVMDSLAGGDLHEESILKKIIQKNQNLLSNFASRSQMRSMDNE